MDELKDVYNHFLLYYGRDIPKMQNAAKAARKKQKRIREDGEEEEGLSLSTFDTFLLVGCLKILVQKKGRKFDEKPMCLHKASLLVILS